MPKTSNTVIIHLRSHAGQTYAAKRVFCPLQITAVGFQSYNAPVPSTGRHMEMSMRVG